jgi:ABC-type glutathione transport system ATPase component
VLALDGVSFTLGRGETLGVVGESGSGKSTLARTLMLLEAATGGFAAYRGHDLVNATAEGRDRLRRQVQMVFQDPTASLNPRMTIRRSSPSPGPSIATCFHRPSGRRESTNCWSRSAS